MKDLFLLTDDTTIDRIKYVILRNTTNFSVFIAETAKFINPFALLNIFASYSQKNCKNILNETCKLFLTQVSKYWNILALDGSNWQKIDLFYFQMDIEVS